MSENTEYRITYTSNECVWSGKWSDRTHRSATANIVFDQDTIYVDLGDVRYVMTRSKIDPNNFYQNHSVIASIVKSSKTQMHINIKNFATDDYRNIVVASTNHKMLVIDRWVDV